MPSSVIKSFSYDPATSALNIIFVSGNIYVYENVPEAVYLKLKSAESKGRFFNSRIKNKYVFRHLDK